MAALNKINLQAISRTSLTLQFFSPARITPNGSLLISMTLFALLLSSSFFATLATTNSVLAASSDSDPHRVALESELASLLLQPPQITRQQQQDLRDKALASAIISRIMLDNLTNPCDSSPTGCQGIAQSINLATFPGEELDLQQQQPVSVAQQHAIDESRLRLLLEQLQILNSQASGQEGGNGEFVIESSASPADQIANIKRASNRFQSKLHLRGLGAEGPIMTSPGQWQQALSSAAASANGHGQHELSLGALKRPDSGTMLRLGDVPSYIKRPSSNNRQFEFGLGKRVASPSYSRYDFGLGKRASGNSLQEYRYDFGLGRR